MLKDRDPQELTVTVGDAEEECVRLVVGEAVTHAEVLLATMSVQGEGAIEAMEGLIASLKIETVDFCANDVPAYKDVATKHHLKAKPPGPLNMGDVFSFQRATELNLPLFFQGKDFLKTSVRNAMTMLGYAMTEQNLGVPAKLDM